MKVGKSRLAYVAVFAVAMAWVEAIHPDDCTNLRADSAANLARP